MIRLLILCAITLIALRAEEVTKPTYEALHIAKLSDIEAEAGEEQERKLSEAAEMDEAEFASYEQKVSNLLGILQQAHKSNWEELHVKYIVSPDLKEAKQRFEDLNKRYDELIVKYLFIEPRGALEKIFLNDYLISNVNYDFLVLSQLLTVYGKEIGAKKIPKKIISQKKKEFTKRLKEADAALERLIKTHLLDARPNDEAKAKFIAQKEVIDKDFDYLITALKITA